MTLPEVSVCPSLLLDGYKTYSQKALVSLFQGLPVNHILTFDSPAAENGDGVSAEKNVGRLSLSGAQPKFGLIIGADMNLRYSLDEEQSTYIMKPRPTGYQVINHDYLMANENLTMQLASQIYRIVAAPNGLCFFRDGSMAYITRRFDVHASGKYAQEDFASLMGRTADNGGSDFKYDNVSYEECAQVIRDYTKSVPVDLLRFFQLILFNFVTLNDDAHLKNFTLLNTGREYHLSPAYDLVNTSLHIREPRIFALEKGLFKEGMELNDTHTVTREHFLEFGNRIGLSVRLVEREIERFAAPSPAADALVNRSLLSPTLKRQYILGYHHRQSMLRP